MAMLSRTSTAGSTARGGRMGFTLLEIMVVLVLMGILSAVILPEMQGSMDEAALRAAGREWVHIFGLAGSHAVSRNEACRVRYLPSVNKYVFERSVEARGGRREFEAISDFPGADGRLDPRIQVQFRRSTSERANPSTEPGPVSRNQNEVSDQIRDGATFYADGTADSVVVLLQDRAGFRLALEVNPVTARIRMKELGAK